MHAYRVFLWHVGAQCNLITPPNYTAGMSGLVTTDLLISRNSVLEALFDSKTTRVCATSDKQQRMSFVLAEIGSTIYMWNSDIWDSQSLTSSGKHCHLNIAIWII